MVGVPEGLGSRNELNRNLGYERPEPVCAQDHASLFGENMPNYYQAFLVACADAVLHVLNEFPLPGFAADQYIDVASGDNTNTGFAAYIAPARSHIAHRQSWISEDTNGPGSKLLLYLPSEACQ